MANTQRNHREHLVLKTLVFPEVHLPGICTLSGESAHCHTHCPRQLGEAETFNNTQEANKVNMSACTRSFAHLTGS